MKSSTLCALILGLALALNTAKANSYVYTFVPTDSGNDIYGGTITLDTAANNNGAVSDVLELKVWGPFPFGSSFTYDSGTEQMSLNSTPFTWTPTAITSMNIGVTASGSSNGQYALFDVYDSGLYSAGMDAGIDGSWVAAASTVPDATDTFLLLGVALAPLAMFRHRGIVLRAVRS